MNEEIETIFLTIPKELYDKLAEVANLSDQTIEDVIRVTLAIVLLEEVEEVEDPHSRSNEV